jgi:Phasin protein
MAPPRKTRPFSTIPLPPDAENLGMPASDLVETRPPSSISVDALVPGVELTTKGPEAEPSPPNEAPCDASPPLSAPPSAAALAPENRNAAAGELQDFHRLTLTAVESAVGAHFDFLSDMARVRTVSEVVAVQTAYAHRQYEAFVAQWKGVAQALGGFPATSDSSRQPVAPTPSVDSGS